MSTLRSTRRFLIGAVALAGALLALPAAAQTTTDLQLTVDGDDPVDITYGQYRIIDYLVTNNGPSAAAGVTLSSLSIPSEFNYSISGCTPVDADVGPVPCTIGTGVLYDSSSPTDHSNVASFSVTVELPAFNADDEPIWPATCTAGDVFDDIVATVTTTTTDSEPSNNTYTIDGLETLPFWDLSIALTAPASASVGDTIQVGALVTNNGPCQATEVSVNDWWWGATSQTLEFISATGACEADTLFGDGCYWDTVDVGEANAKAWSIDYKVLALPAGLIQTGDPVYMDVVSGGAPYFGVADSWRGRGIYQDVDAGNDAAQTKTIVSQTHSGCSTGDFGGALSLLLVAVPFLRRRRQS